MTSQVILVMAVIISYQFSSVYLTPPPPPPPVVTVGKCSQTQDKRRSLIYWACHVIMTSNETLLSRPVIEDIESIMSFITSWYFARVIGENKPPGPLFTKRTDVLPPNLKSRSCEFGCYNDRIALKFDRPLGTTASCQMSKRLNKSKPKSRGFETPWYLTVRRPSSE